MVKGWLTSRLSPYTLSLITGIESAKGVWDILQSVYAQNYVEREFMLGEKLQLLKKEPS